jgi:hypothetical protein
MRTLICLLAMASVLTTSLQAVETSQRSDGLGLKPNTDTSPLLRQLSDGVSHSGSTAISAVSADGHWIRAREQGADIQCRLQGLQGTLDGYGLRLESTIPADFQAPVTVIPRGISRQGRHITDLSRGTVVVSEGVAQVQRQQMTEEISVSIAGIRQDFIIHQRPAGEGDLSVQLSLDGGVASLAQDGVIITMDAGRALRWDRLAVYDADGTKLPAHWASASAVDMAIVVDDADARYPIRIDPTFTDANWAALGEGTNGQVYSLAVFNGDLYVGGIFTSAGVSNIAYIAKWDGTSWMAVGSGLNDAVMAMTVYGGSLYAGGYFTASGATATQRIARWDGTQWNAVTSGVNSYVYSLAVSGNDLYVGGGFSLAGGVSASNIAKWNGTTWSALGTGTNNTVRALSVANGNLYAGGSSPSQEETAPIMSPNGTDPPGAL